MYPVGSVYCSTNIDPSTFIGGTWTRFGQGPPIGIDEKDSANFQQGKIEAVLITSPQVDLV